MDRGAWRATVHGVVQTFSRQLKELGFDYDWDKMIATSDPEFYKWTQWIFKQLYLDGYAQYIDMPVNWCEELGTVLSNDEVIDGKSERGGPRPRGCSGLGEPRPALPSF